MSRWPIRAAQTEGPYELVETPDDILEFFVFPPVVHLGPLALSRTFFLILLAAFIVVGLVWAAYRRSELVPSKFQAGVEGMVEFVTEDIAVGIIGPEGRRYAPYLLSLFLFILVGNLFEVTPGIHFPITSRMAIPGGLALLTWVIFITAGVMKQGPRYFWNAVAPPGVPKLMLFLLVIPIEFVSTFIIRPFSLAVRLFANLVAGHTMLALLLGTTGAYLLHRPLLWKVASVFPFTFGVAIYVFEIAVSFLQAYIFTLLSAVYIQTSIHPEH